MSTLESMTDEELALAYIDGNNRAFDELLWMKTWPTTCFRKPSSN